MRHQIHHRGRRTSYLEARSSAGVSEGTLVFLHAFPLAAGMWAPQMADVPPGWRLVAPDLRGFGHSVEEVPSAPAREPARPDDDEARVSIDDYAEDILALIDHLGDDRVVLAGLSMGGYAAFGVLRAAPARVRALVLADTRPEADTDAARASRDAMLDTLARGGPAAVADRMLPGLLGATTLEHRPDVVGSIRSLAAAQPQQAVRRAILRMRGRPDSTPLLSGIRVPTLVVVGEQDAITDVETARQMHARIAGADLAVIDGAGHLSNIEQPRPFNVVLHRFLSTAFAR